MPANKRRSRNGNGNSSSSSSSSSAAAAAAAAVQHNLKSSINPITKIFNNLNGFANGSNYNGYHHSPIGNHQVNNNHSGSVATATTVVSTANGAITNAPSTFTAKQQQQLDRNAFLLTLTKEQLKVECRKRGQKTTGTKTELVHLIFSLCFIVVVFFRFILFSLHSYRSIDVFFFRCNFIRCLAPPSLIHAIIFNWSLFRSNWFAA